MGESNERDKYFEDRARTDEARFHVVPNDENGWTVKAEGYDEPQFTSEDKRDAVDEAKRMAQETGTMAYVHDDDGKIDEQYNYMD